MRYLANDHLHFDTTGRTAYAYGGIIGISERDAGSIGAYGGYDQEFPLHSEGELTPEERRELADYMIALWTQFKEVN